jgi:hypothetical protein
MKIKKEGSENNPRFKMMEGDDALADIEKTYGKEVKDALVKYCAMKKITPDEVIDDLSEDGNGMTQWDKFDTWAQTKLGLDIMGGFDDDFDYTGADSERKEEDDWESDHRDEFMEGSGSRMDAYDVGKFIEEELQECEWVDDVVFDGYDNTMEIVTVDGDNFSVQVTKL